MSANETSKTETQPAQEVSLADALRLAQGHHKAGNLIIADRTYRDILKAVPDHYPTTLYLGILAYQRGNLDEAVVLLGKSVEIDPDDKSAWANYGVVLASKEKYEEALSAYDKAIELEPEEASNLSNKSYTLWLMKNFAEAETLARQALDKMHNHPGAMMNLGIALAEQKKLEEAEKIWQALTEITPQSSKAYSNWGNTLRSLRRIKDSEEKGRKAIELDPKNPEALTNLGLTLRETGRMSEAEKLYRKATNIKPDYALAHQNLATVLYDQKKYEESVVAAKYALSFDETLTSASIICALSLKELGEHDEAINFAQKAISLDPDEPSTYLTLAEILMQVEKFDEGEAAMNEALKLSPGSIQYYTLLANIRELLAQFDGAVSALNEAIKIAPYMPALWIRKSRMLHLADRTDEAWEAIDKALELAPENIQFLLTKVDMLLTTNRKDEARELIEKVRNMDPEFPGLHFAMSNFKKYTEDDADFAFMKRQYEDKIDEMEPLDASGLCFSLSKAYEDIGDNDLAFKYLAEGNEIKGKTVYYNNETQEAIYAGNKASYVPELFKKFADCGSKSQIPVFIVGMPRSGTTLTEQIISSHPDVYGAGELSLLGRVIRELGPMTPENAAEMGEAYVKYIKKLDKTGKAKRITDKMPGNFHKVGIIECILPHAKIIHCRRNPVDTSLSCFKQNFAYGQGWSYSLENLAKEYNRYLDMMDHWEKVLPGRILHIDYEETVSNLEEQARKLIDFVDLPWNDACLEPHKQKRTVLTASKDQVIKPVYQSSVEKWRRFEKHLQPLVTELLPESPA